MKNNFSQKSDALLRKKTNEELLAKRSDFSQKWLHKSGKLFKLLIVLIWLVGIYNLIMFAAQTMGNWLMAADNQAYLTHARNSSITLGIIVVGLVLLFFKKHILSSSFAIIYGIFYLTNTPLASEIIIESKQQTAAYMYIPSTIAVMVLALCIIIILTADKIQFVKTYNKILDKIVATYPTVEGEITTEEEWDRRIEEYVTPKVHKKPKKSLRKKKNKNQSDSE